ncbi:MAG: viral A-type inclusion protein [Lepagella sp.]
MAKRRKFVDENKKAFQELGLSVNSVKDAEEVLVNNTSNVVQSFILRAKAAALDKAVTQAYSTMLERQDLARRNARYTVKSQGNEVSYADAQARGMAGVRAVPHEHVRANGGGATMSSWTTYTYEVSDAGAYNAASNRLALEARDLEIQAAAAEADRRVNDLQKEIGATEEALNALKIPQMTGGTTPTTTTTNSTKEDRLEAARKEAEELQKLRWQNEQDEINQMADGAERRRRQIALDYKKELAEIEDQKASFKALNKESGATGLNADGLTETQQTEIDRAGRIALENQDKAMQAVYQLELQHMEEYLKEYGTFQQKKLAMSEEYNRKIAEASDEWVKKSLEKEKATVLQNIEIDAIKQSVDWGSVFSGFGTMFRDQLEPTIAKLRAISETEEFRNSDLQDQQTLYELIAKLEEANTSWDSGIFVTLGNDLTAYQTAMRNYMDAQDKEWLATEALTAAKRKLAQAEQSGNADAITAAKTEVATATINMNEASDRVRSFGADVQEASNSLQASTTRVNNMFNTLVSSLAGLKSGSLQGVGESLMSLDKLFNNSGITNAVGGALAKGMSKLLGNSAIGKSVSEALGNSGLIGSIISAVLSLLDILKDGIGVLVSSLIDTVLNAISGILKNLLNGKMFVQIGQSLIDGIAGIFDAITFGGFTSWFSSSNAKEVQETIDKLTERNELLQTAIEDLTDEIKASKGTKSVAAYRDAYNYQRETNANYLGIAQAQAGYYGAHHSWNYYWDGFSQEQIERLSRQIGRSWDGNIWSLSPEEMKMLRANVDMWKQIQDTGKGGYGGRLTEKLDDYIAQAGKLEELTTQLYEGLTGISFDSMYDSFINQLMDMEASTQDFADNISEYFMRAMLSNKIGEMYADKLEEWWKKFGKAMEDNDLTEEERNALSEEYMKYVEEAMRLRDQLAAATGYGSEDKSSSQSGKVGSYNAISQDQGTKLEGLFVSVQGHVANIDTIVENVAERMSAAEGYLAQIAENTKSNAASAEEIKELLIKIARDGIRTK